MKPVLSIGLILTAAAFAQGQPAGQNCSPVGGVLFTNVAAIESRINFGVVYGDLAGAVAAAITSGPETVGFPAQGRQQIRFTVQHYWVTEKGELIFFKPATATADTTSKQNVVAITYDNYVGIVSGGTGRFVNATGTVKFMGTVDFNENHLVLRYAGEVCTPSR
ncbi:MAG TPA: hypothetical protein VGF49_06275 [Candidatus Solibacter sp.]|jgi:hypothetical protein